MTRHTVKLHNIVVGHSELENIDLDLGRAWGAFRPGLGYELVQPVFRLYARAVSPTGATHDAELLERYYKARDALKLELTDGDEGVIDTSVIHIADYTVEDGPRAIALDVLIRDEVYWAKRATAPDAR
jgi:hypothetical protein